MPKSIEEILKEKSERLELVIEGTRLGIWDWNPQTNDVVFNQRWAEMLGIDFSTMAHNLETWSSRVHPDDIDSCYQDITAHMEGRVDFYENVHRMKHEKGHWVYILDRGKVMERDSEGKVVRFTGTHTDITPQKLAEEKALQLADFQTQFLANMSHEIRTPLNGVIGLIDVLKDTDLNHEALEIVQIMNESANFLHEIINDILDFSKMQAGEFSLVEEPFNPTALFGSVQRLFENKATRKGIAIEFELQNLPEALNGDQTRVQQILFNLVSNAIKFTKTGGVFVRVDCTPLSDELACLKVEVQDTGIGIQDVQKVWEKFVQEDKRIGKSAGGTGLGLAICKNLITLMGGEIHVESMVGEGSRFVFEIPLGIGVSVSELQETQENFSINSKEAFIIDDQRANQFVLEMLLRSFNIQCTCLNAYTNLLPESSFDKGTLFFVDINLKEENGLEVIADLRKKNPTALIVGVSADVVSDYQYSCIEQGANAFLPKPIRKKDLEGVLRKLNLG